MKQCLLSAIYIPSFIILGNFDKNKDKYFNIDVGMNDIFAVRANLCKYILLSFGKKSMVAMVTYLTTFIF